MLSKGKDGSEDQTASSAISEVWDNFTKEIPKSWDGFGIDHATLEAHMDSGNSAGVAAMNAVTLCGAKIGSVFTGLDNSGLASLRLQA